MFPGLYVELCRGVQRHRAQLRRLRFEGSLQMRADRVVFWRELLDQFLHHLRVAEGAQRPEKFSRCSTHRRPDRVGIHFLHGRGDRAASANGHAKIMDSVCAWRCAHQFPFFQDLFHPERKIAVLRMASRRNGSNCGHGSPQDARPDVSWPDGNPCRARKHRLALCNARVQSACGYSVEILKPKRTAQSNPAATPPRQCFLECRIRTCYFCFVHPEWRNWQTRWTQNPVVLSTVWVRPPPPGPSKPRINVGDFACPNFLIAQLCVTTGFANS